MVVGGTMAHNAKGTVVDVDPDICAPLHFAPR